jgi:hypothetical protein
MMLYALFASSGKSNDASMLCEDLALYTVDVLTGPQKRGIAWELEEFGAHQGRGKAEQFTARPP